MGQSLDRQRAFLLGVGLFEEGIWCLRRVYYALKMRRKSIVIAASLRVDDVEVYQVCCT